MHLRTIYPRLMLATLALCLAALAPPAVQAQSDPGSRSQQLLAQLENGDPLQQEQAAQELAAVASPTYVPDLTRIFQTSDNPRPAATVLGAIGTPPAMAVLVNGLSDENLSAKRNAAQLILLEKGVDAVPALSVGLQSSDPFTRQHAAQVLGFVKSPRGVNPLLRVAKDDPVARVRQEAVWALGEIGEARTRLALKAIARTDPDEEVRIEAERATLRAGGDF